MSVSVTISNRRVRTRTHGGVAGVSGQPLPLCRSSRQPLPWDYFPLARHPGATGNPAEVSWLRSNKETV
jgi:hypothetical protein